MDKQMAKTYKDLLKEIEDVDSKIEVIKSEIERLTGKNKYLESEGDDSNKSVLSFSVCKNHLIFFIFCFLDQNGHLSAEK